METKTVRRSLGIALGGLVAISSHFAAAQQLKPTERDLWLITNDHKLTLQAFERACTENVSRNNQTTCSAAFSKIPSYQQHVLSTFQQQGITRAAIVDMKNYHGQVSTAFTLACALASDPYNQRLCKDKGTEAGNRQKLNEKHYEDKIAGKAQPEQPPTPPPHPSPDGKKTCFPIGNTGRNYCI